MDVSPPIRLRSDCNGASAIDTDFHPPHLLAPMNSNDHTSFQALGARILTIAVIALAVPSAPADEHLFGYTRGAETLPAGHYDVYQFTTLRAGKDVGTYRAWDFETEAEYGLSDKLQASLAVVNHYFKNSGMEELEDQSRYRFGGLEAAVKYRLKSPFIDGYGLAIRPEIGFSRYDDVGGLLQHELLLGSTLIYQHNYFDDTLIFSANAGFDFTWGKQPAEAYDHELLLDGLAGLSYRFAPGWFAGVEGHIHAEYPNFDVGTHEHTVLFAGPSLHYGARRWWATLTWVYQVYGAEVDATVPHHAYAEESRNEYRLKIGLNF
jgi:hypothetical protein